MRAEGVGHSFCAVPTNPLSTLNPNPKPLKHLSHQTLNLNPFEAGGFKGVSSHEGLLGCRFSGLVEPPEPIAMAYPALFGRGYLPRV